MKPLFVIVAFVCLTALPMAGQNGGFSSYSVNSNPFAAIGITDNALVITGYDQLPQSDSIMTVYGWGYNKYTGEVAFIKDETELHSTQLFEGEQPYRWLSVDPVVKANESPYASYSNNPILFIDKDGRDTLIVHRSKDSQTFGDAKIYVLTFSIVKDGVQTTFPGNPILYMMANGEAEKKGDNSLSAQKFYKMVEDVMSSQSEGKWPGQRLIRITEFGIFIHPGTTLGNFNGCLGVTACPPQENFVAGNTTYDIGILFTGDLEYSNSWIKDNYPEYLDADGKITGGLREIWNMYDYADGGVNGGQLTGDKFLLQPNSEAPMKQLTIKTINKVSASENFDK